MDTISEALPQSADLPAQSRILVGVKRHRDQPPLAALVYDLPASPTLGRRKKRARVTDVGAGDAADSGMFRFAETMDESSWLAAQKGMGMEALHERINTLVMSKPDEVDVPKPELAQPADVTMDAPTDDSQPKRVYRILPRRKSAAFTNLSTGTSSPLESKPDVPATIAEEKEPAPAVQPPPFKYVEAELVPVDEPAVELKQVKKVQVAPDVESDRDMDMFSDMVEKFLRVHGDLEPDRPLKRPSRVPTPGARSTADSTPAAADMASKAAPLTAKAALNQAIADAGPNRGNGDDEYVYDLFYFSREKAAQIQMMQMVNRGQIASLTGMSAVFDESEDYGSSEEEVDSEVDEDSNDENFYRNDYPDEVEDDDEGDIYSDSDDLERRQRIEDGTYDSRNYWEEEDKSE